MRATIGEGATALVREVTNPSATCPDLPRAERKAMDRAHIASISQRAKCLKLADRIDNLRDGTARPDRAWLKIYANESRLLAQSLAGADAELEEELLSAIAVAEQAAG